MGLAAVPNGENVQVSTNKRSSVSLMAGTMFSFQDGNYGTTRILIGYTCVQHHEFPSWIRYTNSVESE